jgi:uncharacterized protein (DUF486 family)
LRHGDRGEQREGGCERQSQGKCIALMGRINAASLEQDFAKNERVFAGGVFRPVAARDSPEFEAEQTRTAMPTFISPYLLPILLLLGSNIFMTIAWYGHLRFKEMPLIGVILASWGIALVEYCMAVPANRWGNAVYTTAELKTMQEVITLLVFAGFSVLYLKEAITWNHAIGFAFIAAGAFFVFRGPL